MINYLTYETAVSSLKDFREFLFMEASPRLFALADIKHECKHIEIVSCTSLGYIPLVF